MGKVDLKIDWATHEAAKYACLHWHYSGCIPKSKLVKIGVWENDVFKGVIIPKYQINIPYSAKGENMIPDIKDLPEKKLLLVSEAAAYFTVHERTIRRWIKAGKIGHEKLAGSIRISRESIVKFRASGVTINN